MHTIILGQLYSELQPPNAEPFSIEVLAGALGDRCPNCRTQYAVINPATDPDAVSRFIGATEALRADFVALSVPQGTYPLALQLLHELDTLKRTHPSRTVVLGHALPTYAPDAFLTAHPNVVAVRGWGERALVDLVNGVARDDIPGLVRSIDGKIRIGVDQPAPHPARPFRIDPHRYFSRVEFSRGCHYGRCTFCTRPPGGPDYWSRVPLEDVLNDVLLLKKSGVSYFTFTDEDFIGNDPPGVLALARALADIGGLTFSISVRAETIAPESPSNDMEGESYRMLSDLVAAGLVFVYIGAESFSDSQLKRFGKATWARRMHRAMTIAERLDVVIELGFILSDPFVTFDELKDNASLLRRSGAWKYVSNLFSEVRVQKGSPLETLLRQRGLLGRFDVNLLSYAWDYHDSRVASFVRSCVEWVAPFHGVVRLLRNLLRTTASPAFVKEALLAFRELDLSVLERRLEAAGAGADAGVVPTECLERRLRLSKRLCDVLRPVAQAPEERALLEAVDSFVATSSTSRTAPPVLPEPEL